jgi:hypothetical protein
MSGRPCLTPGEVSYLRLCLRQVALERLHEAYIIWEVQHARLTVSRTAA